MSRTRLAFIPLGTGNDLCRTLGIPLDPVEALSVLDMGRMRKIDVMRVEGGYSGFAVNAATGGLSGRVAADVTAEMKAFWGPFAYLRGAAGPVAERAAYRLSLRFDDGPPEVFEALNIVVANARTAAGGFTVAPTANLEDGLLDVVIVRASDFLDLSVIAAHLMAGDYLADANVLHRVARKVEIESDPPMPFSIDGEVAEGPRFAFSIVPRALRVLVGPTYHSDPTRRDGRNLRQSLFGLLAHVLHMVRSVPRAYALALLVAVAGGVAGWLMWK